MQPLTWNADQEIIGKTRRGRDIRQTDIYGKWVNYLADIRTWLSIDMSLSPRVGVYEMRKAPFQAELPVLSTGQALFIADNRYSPKNMAQITDAPFNCLMRPIGPLIKEVVGDMQGNKVVYAGAYGDGADYILQTYHGRIPRLRKLVQFNKAPVSNLKLEFELELPDLYELSVKDFPGNWNGAETSILGDVALMKRGSLERGLHFSRARIWDSGLDDAQKTAFVPVSLRMQGGRLIITKHIPVSFFDHVVFPVFTDTDFYPDPSSGGTTVDGVLLRSVTNEDWATIIGSTGTAVNVVYEAQWMWGVYSGTSAWDRNRWTIFTFDTSIIGTDEISAGSFSFYTDGTWNKLDQNGWTDAHLATHLVASDPAADNNLEVADYLTVGGTSFGNKAWDDISAEGYNVIAMSEAGIATIVKSGITPLGLVSGAHFLAEAPVRGDSAKYTELKGYFSDYNGGSLAPKLSVTHAPVGGLLNRVMGVV